MNPIKKIKPKEENVKIDYKAMAAELIEAIEEAIATAKAAALSPVVYRKWEAIVARAKGLL